VSGEREELANLIPLGYRADRDGVADVFEAADRILASDWLKAHDARVRAEELCEAAASFDVNPMPSLRLVRGRVSRILMHRAVSVLRQATTGHQGRNEAPRSAERAESDHRCPGDGGEGAREETL
jgi:hypothetical protein